MSVVRLEEIASILVVTIDRPQARNAVDDSVAAAIGVLFYATGLMGTAK